MVGAVDDLDVPIVQRSRADPDQNFLPPWLRHRPLHDTQSIRPATFFKNDCPHETVLLETWLKDGLARSNLQMHIEQQDYTLWYHA